MTPDPRSQAVVDDSRRTDPLVTVPDAEHANWRWRAVVQTAGPAVVVDMDGVVSDASKRQHFLRGGRRDWDGFFGACGEDTPIEEVARLLGLLAPELQVVLLTARPTSVQPQTLEWLARHRLRWDLLVMRPDGDRIPSEVYKRRSVHQLRKRGFDLQLAFEDDKVNRQMLIDEGIPCVYIHSGYYER